jgi:hypothetical protein
MLFWNTIDPAAPYRDGTAEVSCAATAKISLRTGAERADGGCYSAYQPFNGTYVARSGHADATRLPDRGALVAALTWGFGLERAKGIEPS